MQFRYICMSSNLEIFVQLMYKQSKVEKLSNYVADDKDKKKKNRKNKDTLADHKSNTKLKERRQVKLGAKPKTENNVIVDIVNIATRNLKGTRNLNPKHNSHVNI